MKSKKRNGLSKTKIMIIIISFIMFTFLCTYFLFFSKYFMNKFRIDNYEKEYTLTYGTSYEPNIKVCYGNDKNCTELTPTVEGEVDPNTIGEYLVRYKYTYKNKEMVLDQFVKVTDNQGPTITINNEDDLKVCPNGKVLNLDADIKDNMDGTDVTTDYNLNGDLLTITLTDKNGNKTTKEVKVNVIKDSKPTITINGKKNMTVTLNSKYNEQGATATDECDGDLSVTTEGTVDPNTIGEYKITYSATDKDGNTVSAVRTVSVREKIPGEKVIYLTFDDGPGAYTGQLLDVLKKYNVKATFFVTCKGDESLIKREYNEGHTVALHTCSHVYKEIYASYDAYFKDLYKVRDRVKRITGYEANIIRFPGGTSNGVSPNISMKSLASQVLDKGFVYFDWNVSSGDAGGQTTADGVYNQVINNLSSKSSVILQHDIKKYSVNAVERIIQYGLDNGYTFERLHEDSPSCKHKAGH